LRKILLSEAIEEAGLQVLRGKAEIIISPDPSSETVGRLLHDADALIVRTATLVTKKMIEEAPRLKVISRTGGGLNNVDIEAATACNVVVAGVKGPQDRYVAEHTIAMITSLSKQLFYLDAQTRIGNFKSRFEYRPSGLNGKRLGLVGYGRIGKIVASVAQALGMEVWVYDPYLTAEALEGTGVRLEKDVDTVICSADYLSLHVPATAETKEFMNRERFKMMKPTAYFINTARGEIVQEAGLIEALQSGWIAGAALDVLASEPPKTDNPLMKMDNVILTPHTAGLTKEAVAILAEGAALNALAVLEGKSPSFSGNWDQVNSRSGR